MAKVAAEEAEAEEEAAGYRIKNKNPTQRCREKQGRCQVPRLSRKVERRHPLPSAPKRAEARHQSQPSAISAV